MDEKSIETTHGQQLDHNVKRGCYSVFTLFVVVIAVLFVIAVIVNSFLNNRKKEALIARQLAPSEIVEFGKVSEHGVVDECWSVLVRTYPTGDPIWLYVYLGANPKGTRWRVDGIYATFDQCKDDAREGKIGKFAIWP